MADDISAAWHCVLIDCVRSCIHLSAFACVCICVYVWEGMCVFPEPRRNTEATSVQPGIDTIDHCLSWLTPPPPPYGRVPPWKSLSGTCREATPLDTPTEAYIPDYRLLIFIYS